MAVALASPSHPPIPSSSRCSASAPSTASSSSSSSKFAIAQIRADEVCLLQLAPESCSLTSTCFALSAVEANVYRHEFINIFRHSHRAILHPSDVRVLELIDDANVLHEEDKGTALLSRDVMERLRKLTDRRRTSGMGNPHGSRPPSCYAHGYGQTSGRRRM
ncbi:hypothetical protein OF83DRAFT_292886 [Amylostereum chailletii]|nr:hypothetical protein OF83DRAFT_292886 [Amylostereum chailletii]